MENQSVNTNDNLGEYKVVSPLDVETGDAKLDAKESSKNAALGRVFNSLPLGFLPPKVQKITRQNSTAIAAGSRKGRYTNQNRVDNRTRENNCLINSCFCCVGTCSILQLIPLLILVIFQPLISIAAIVIGSIHLHDCPVEKQIPILLIVVGVFSLFSCKCECKGERGNNKESKKYSASYNIFFLAYAGRRICINY